MKVQNLETKVSSSSILDVILRNMVELIFSTVMINYFCRKVDRQKELSLISSRQLHIQS